uniref:pyruvate decarboxylase n=1 Tax=Polytomella parva TaxID=51329 RepID=A0A7S0YE52_9CHLO|mmetsp:Transcript_21108/g.37692  ORF Transcript_21108/g.37692 Transcript_21108/m.37692 type:complete len:578 (+) Transcript_21108:117-1850(+)|eukprot:CAMPEP_0175069250 /NCGR_PEP_ID=MMETSP0052_2-20121109/18098_1 /TAXON_ID=51329 ORGANISM="Polytomella parva, Strain SAG 63-3" /NCGR_SAMPLE_ID=MMETSP0052_2 /ASSEMBLY_ACC=CAM_ASM_000194 /LENGTH=577 /DNA_ID=CAMNT_0016336319 /DNA_START=29 /DNA_END=1762 /DNA_ORIENTATION=-
MNGDANVGLHIANRLVELGCNHIFAVPGDFNLLLLDQFLKHEKLNMIWCCNELNAGYAADGYARRRGIGCVTVTFCVGGFSVINAVAGAYSEDLPLVCISGGPNSNDFSSNHVLHHTIGLSNDYGQQLRAFREVTCCQVLISHLEDAYRQVDVAISEAVRHRKPVYIEVSCNLASLPHPSFSRVLSAPIPFVIEHPRSNARNLTEAVSAAAQELNAALKAIIIVGPRCRRPEVQEAVLALANASQYPVVISPDAKGFFPENHASFCGLYWGAVSSTCVSELVESAGVVLAIGCVWTDYSTVGYTLPLRPPCVVEVDERAVVVCGKATFTGVMLLDVLRGLVPAVRPNKAGLQAFLELKHVHEPPPPTRRVRSVDPITVETVFSHVQKILTPHHTIISEVGDAWFNTQGLRLPGGAAYEMQMRYGSIGWSVGSVLGYQLADAFLDPKRRTLAFVGDGSFQMTAQEVSTMLRYGLKPIIFLINNGGYASEADIADGPYNIIKNWDYTKFVKALRNDEGQLYTAKVKTEKEFVVALAEAVRRTDELCFIEIFVNKDDCSKELLEWGSRVATCNGRLPVEH